MQRECSLATSLLTGKTAIITGGAQGQGADEAKLFAAHGANVLITDLLEKGESVAREIGDRAHFVKHDVASEDDWTRVVDEALHRFGSLDILVNNAGVYRPKGLADTDTENFTLHYRINQLGPFLGMRAVLEPMRRQGKGSIINVSSGSALAGTPGMFGYASSKWALRGMSRCAARDLAAFGIRVNVLLPGLIATPMADSNSDEMKAMFVSMIPMGRFGDATEVAEMALFLASDLSSYMTGGEFKVDGGLNA